jgi:hypothetical protein
MSNPHIEGGWLAPRASVDAIQRENHCPWQELSTVWPACSQKLRWLTCSSLNEKWFPKTLSYNIESQFLLFVKYEHSDKIMMGDMCRSCSTPRKSWKMQRNVQLEDQKRQQHFGDLLLLCNLLPLTQSIVLTLTVTYNFFSHLCHASWYYQSYLFTNECTRTVLKTILKFTLK